MKFRINYSKVISQAEEIRQYAQKLSAQARLLIQLEQECRAAWSGEAAEAFLKRLHAMQLELRRSASQMESLALTIRECAQDIQNRDRQAAEKAASLSLGR